MLFGAAAKTYYRVKEPYKIPLSRWERVRVIMNSAGFPPPSNSLPPSEGEL